MLVPVPFFGECSRLPSLTAWFTSSSASVEGGEEREERSEEDILRRWVCVSGKRDLQKQLWITECLRSYDKRD